jgi:hypothetical protein
MWQVILKVATVYFSCMLKFIFGPLGGYAAGFTLLTTILITVAGMMTVVFVLLFLQTGFGHGLLAASLRKGRNSVGIADGLLPFGESMVSLA